MYDEGFAAGNAGAPPARREESGPTHVEYGAVGAVRAEEGHCSASSNDGDGDVQMEVEVVLSGEEDEAPEVT